MILFVTHAGEEGREVMVDKDEKVTDDMTTKPEGAPREFWISEFLDYVSEGNPEFVNPIHVISFEAYQAAIERAEAAETEVETVRMQLAACGVAAMSNTEDTIKQRITKDNSYWSASYGDVCNSVDREIKWRKRAESLTKFLEENKGQVIPVKTVNKLLKEWKGE